MVICFSISILIPLIGLVSTYSAPTASFALIIEDSGKIPPEVSDRRSNYWRSALEVEMYYPAPSLLLATFSIITRAPHDYLMFIPIANLAKIIYFVLAKRILNSLIKKKVMYDLFALVYYIFVVIGFNINAGSIGRAVIGIVLLAYLIYTLLIFVDRFINKNLHSYTSPKREFYVMTILTLAIGLSYYTSTLIVFLITLLVPIFIRIFINKKLPTLYLYNIFAISLILILYNPFYYSLTKSLSFENFFINTLEFIKAQLKLERAGEAFELSVGQIEIDLFTRVTGVWFKTMLVLFSGFATINMFIKTSILLAKKQLSDTNDKLLWIYSLIVMSASVSELSYSLYAPIITTRAITIYGSLILIYIIKNIFEKNNNFVYKIYEKRNSISMVFGILTLMIFILSTIGNLVGGWFYGLSQPFGYKKVYDALTFIEKYSSEEPVNVALDAWYSALGLLHSTIFSKHTIVAYEPLGRGTFILAESILRNDLTTFLSYSCKKGITYVLLNDNTKPIFGDEWGYTVTLKDKTVLKTRLSMLYTKGEFYLLHIPIC